jgi:hypothetical protein
LGSTIARLLRKVETISLIEISPPFLVGLLAMTGGQHPPGRVTLSGDHAGSLAGDYIVEERHADGRVILRPDLSTRAMLERHGERELTEEEYEQHFGGLPTDGEG